MSGPTPEGAFDFYGAHYARFASPLAAAIRREVYGQDLGQTGWRSAAEQAEIASSFGSGPRRAARHRLRLRRPDAGPRGADGCRVVGLDVEPAGIARAQEAAARGAGIPRRVPRADCGGPLPFPDATFDAVLCVDAINHLPDRLGVLREWARLLRPGGRLLFTDPVVLTGAVAKAELDVRADLGFYLFVPPGVDEAAIAAAGLTALRADDRTAAVAEIAGRWQAVRARHAEALEREEGAAWFARRQRFLAITAELAADGRLSRFMHLAEKPA